MKETSIGFGPLKTLKLAALILLGMGNIVSAQQSIIDEVRDIEGFPKNAQFCLIQLMQPGTLGASYDGYHIGSTEAGGVPGKAKIIASNSSYRVSTQGPTGFTYAPSGVGDGIRFNVTMSGRGSTNFGDSPGTTEVKIKRGMTDLRLNVSATRLDGAFPSGTYATEVTLRCE